VYTIHFCHHHSGKGSVRVKARGLFGHFGKILSNMNECELHT
jgi:hypothetical protein